MYMILKSNAINVHRRINIQQDTGCKKGGEERREVGDLSHKLCREEIKEVGVLR